MELNYEAIKAAAQNYREDMIAFLRKWRSSDLTKWKLTASEI